MELLRLPRLAIRDEVKLRSASAKETTWPRNSRKTVRLISLLLQQLFKSHQLILKLALSIQSKARTALDCCCSWASTSRTTSTFLLQEILRGPLRRNLWINYIFAWVVCDREGKLSSYRSWVLERWAREISQSWELVRRYRRKCRGPTEQDFFFLSFF